MRVVTYGEGCSTSSVGRSTIDGAVYTLDADGNRTAKQDDLAGVASNYTYDKIYELTQVTQGANTTESYSYDPVGNRLSSLGLSPYNVNTSNELTSTPNASYTYDNNGNTTSKTNSRGTTNYTWDFETQIGWKGGEITFTRPGCNTPDFRINPFGDDDYPPHYHRKGPGGIGSHRPWDGKW